MTEVHEGSPAAKAGLRMHDKILQVNKNYVNRFNTVTKINQLAVRSKLNALKFDFKTKFLE